MSTTTTEPSTAPVALAGLADRIRGSVHLPGTADYLRLATPWNVAVPTRPVAVVAVADANDVAETVRWGAEHDVQVAVRSTGHGATATLDGVLLVHTGALDELSVDASGSARVGAGVRWKAVIEAGAPLGLAAPCGSAPNVGVAGFLTGGGLGPLARTIGVSSDRVTAFDVVTGDGVLRRASATEHPALFWGLRGGKGALGIVTAIELDLVPLPALFAGALFFDGSDAAVVLHAWATWSDGLPTEATTSIAVLRMPPMPGVPAPLAGRTTVAVRFAWTGDAADGDSTLAPMRAVAPVIFGGVGPMPLDAVGMIHSDPVDPMPAKESAALLRELPATAVDTLLAVAGPDSGCTQVVVEIRQLGGAVAEGGSERGAFCHRDTAFTLLTIGVAAPPVIAAAEADSARIMTAMAPWTTGAGLPNFGVSTSPERAATVYDRDTLARLGTLVAAFDPASVLADAEQIRAACARLALA